MKKEAILYCHILLLLLFSLFASSGCTELGNEGGVIDHEIKIMKGKLPVRRVLTYNCLNQSNSKLVYPYVICEDNNGIYVYNLIKKRYVNRINEYCETYFVDAETSNIYMDTHLVASESLLYLICDDQIICVNLSDGELVLYASYEKPIRDINNHLRVPTSFYFHKDVLVVYSAYFIRNPIEFYELVGGRYRLRSPIYCDIDTGGRALIYKDELQYLQPLEDEMSSTFCDLGTLSPGNLVENIGRLKSKVSHPKTNRLIKRFDPAFVSDSSVDDLYCYMLDEDGLHSAMGEKPRFQSRHRKSAYYIPVGFFDGIVLFKAIYGDNSIAYRFKWKNSKLIRLADYVNREGYSFHPISSNILSWLEYGDTYEMDFSDPNDNRTDKCVTLKKYSDGGEESYFAFEALSDYWLFLEFGGYIPETRRAYYCIEKFCNEDKNLQVTWLEVDVRKILP